MQIVIKSIPNYYPHRENQIVFISHPLINLLVRTIFDGVGPICRLETHLSLQVGEIKARKFAMGRNMA